MENPMENRFVNTHSTPELRRKARRALVACGLWLRIGFVGASAVAVGLLLLFDGEVAPLLALALAVGGGVLAAASWWRAATVLDVADGAAAVTDGASLPASARAAAGIAPSAARLRGTA